jgi:hypothetical protein
MENPWRLTNGQVCFDRQNDRRLALLNFERIFSATQQGQVGDLFKPKPSYTITMM